MAAQAGRLIAINLDATGSGSYQAIAALRTKSLKLNSEFVDITTSDSSNQWREGLANAGVKSIEISGSGVFTDATYQNLLVTYAMQNTIRNWQLVHTQLGTFVGPFHVSAFEVTGDYNGEVTFTMTLMSAGEITFTAS